MSDELDHLAPATFFENLPSEFISDWLPARVGNLGWPPSAREQSWRNVLGDSPARWRLYRWQASEVDLHSVIWRQDTENTIQQLSDACFRGVNNSYSGILNQSLGKIARLQAYAIIHGSLPSRLLLAETNDGLFLVDGYHRVSWFRFTAGLIGKAFPVSAMAPCYIGRYENGSAA